MNWKAFFDDIQQNYADDGTGVWKRRRTMKVYIASVFADKDRVKARCEELHAVGIETTVRWAYETVPHNCKITDKPDQYMRETAVVDLDDIIAADVLVLTVPTASECMNLTPHQLSRGGRHFESALFYGLMYSEQQWRRSFEREGCRFLTLGRELIILGARENVFHFLDGIEEAANYPAIRRFDTWEEVKQYLIERSANVEQATVRNGCC